MRIKRTYPVLLAMAITGCAAEIHQVSFQQNVRPILQENCIECHTAYEGEGYLETGLTLASYEELMQGDLYGPVVVPGDSRHSILNMLVEGRADPSIRMPHGRDPLTPEDIEILRLWVDQGAQNN